MLQPRYPLKISAKHGAYASITDIKENIKQNVRFLLLTSPGEWPGRPEFGCGLRRFLFANSTTAELSEISVRVKEQFSRYLPFVEIETELIKEDSTGYALVDSNEIKLIVRYSIPSLNYSDLMTLSIGDGTQEVAL